MQKKLEEYARLLIEIGLNVQKGQYVIINCLVECADFARLCTKSAFDVGAKDVLVQWRDDFVSRQRWLYADDEVFDHVYPWDVQRNLSLAKQGAARLSISAQNPENLKGVDPGRLMRFEKADGEEQKEMYSLLMSSSFPWCVASIPVPSWAAKVFPDIPRDEAVARLWDAIFDAVRITGDGNAVEHWRNHCGRLRALSEKLNEYNFKYLHYTNAIGTDLMVELPENHIWAAGSEYSRTGVEFVANIPTEEVFTAPKRDGVNGKVVASKPLVNNGNVIDGFHMLLKDGVITEVHADKGEDVLKAAISVDEGASRFGEVALVPCDSPISNSGILFYNTLFDENASCHFAFGEAYPSCIKGGVEMTSEELQASGLNSSATHVDFMVGTADLSIVGITHSGEEIAVFKDGNFVI